MSSESQRHCLIVAMRHFLHSFHILSISNTLNEVHCINYLFLRFAIVFQHEKRCLAPLLLDDVPGFLDGVQFATLRGQEHLLKLIIKELSHYLCFVHT